MLYVVSTPIGNLGDLSLRQAETLLSSDIIIAEDTRSAGALLDACRKRFNSLSVTDNSPKLISYYKEKEFEKLPQIIEFLIDGKNVCLISENGTPLVSDPGYLLVKTAIGKNLGVTVIPGPSAVITALIYSGFNPNPKNGGFCFMGFFPKKENDIKKLINRLIKIKELEQEMVIVLYDSPQRINKTLSIIDESEWNPDIAICREMTKKFEEVIRGKATDLKHKEFKGEITVVLK